MTLRHGTRTGRRRRLNARPLLLRRGANRQHVLPIHHHQRQHTQLGALCIAQAQEPRKPRLPRQNHNILRVGTFGV